MSGGFADFAAHMAVAFLLWYGLFIKVFFFHAGAANSLVANTDDCKFASFCTNNSGCDGVWFLE